MMKIIHGNSELIGGQKPVIIYKIYSPIPVSQIVPPDSEAIPARRKILKQKY
jgi:hypothetical protein